MTTKDKKIRFNPMDFIILIFLLAVIGVATLLILRERHEEMNSRYMGNMAFTVRISSVDENALYLFDRGVIVKDSVTGSVIGEIVSVYTENTKFYGNVAVMTENGPVLPVSEYEDRYDVYVTVVATAGRSENGIHYVGNTKILIGSTVYFKIPSFTATSYVTDFVPMVVD
jgi:hypothetical protein